MCLSLSGPVYRDLSAPSFALPTPQGQASYSAFSALPSLKYSPARRNMGQLIYTPATVLLAPSSCPTRLVMHSACVLEQMCGVVAPWFDWNTLVETRPSAMRTGPAALSRALRRRHSMQVSGGGGRGGAGCQHGRWTVTGGGGARMRRTTRTVHTSGAAPRAMHDCTQRHGDRAAGQVSIFRYMCHGGADAVAILVIMALHPNTSNATHAKQGKSARSRRGSDTQKLARADTIV